MDKGILLELLGVGKEHTAEEYRQNFLKDDFSARRRHSDEDYENGTISLEDQEQMGECEKFTVRLGTVWQEKKGKNMTLPLTERIVLYRCCVIITAYMFQR